jgi:hypothetical protein
VEEAMRNVLCFIGLLTTGLITTCAAAQSSLPLSSLCDLQTKVTRGEHERVRVEGVFLPGMEGQYLVAANCSRSSTSIEFDLTTHRNLKTLWRMARNPHQGKNVHGDGQPVLVVFEGEFYGPPVPDPKLPPAILKNYHPGWDSNSMTKLDVSAIESVKPVPADNPCAPPKSGPNDWPCFQHDPVGISKPAGMDVDRQAPILQEAARPMYPPIARAAHITGKVAVQVAVKDGQVVKADVVSKLDPAGQRFLETVTVENVKTWRFASDVTGTFTVTYTYAISGDETDNPTNPRVEMLPSLDVNITARPVKPTVNYGAQSVPATDTALHEPGHVLAAVQP